MKAYLNGILSVFFIIAAMENVQPQDPFLEINKDRGSIEEGIALSDLSPQQVAIKVTGTGETTGHILDVHFKNLTSNDILINITPYYVPSDGEHQAYIAPLSVRVRLQSNSEVIHPMHGYCTDVNTPPVPRGEPTLSPDQWITPNMSHFDQNGYNPDLHPGRFYKSHISTPAKLSDPVSSPGISNELLDGIIITPISRAAGLIDAIRMRKGDSKPRETDRDKEGPTYDYPGALPSEPIVILPANVIPRDYQDEIFREKKGEPFLVRVSGDMHFDLPIIQVDPKIQPEITADLFYDAVVKITAAADDLIGSGNLLTPYSHQPKKERESIIQHTLWRYTSAVTGISYTQSDFREQLLDQFHEMSGMVIGEAPEELQQQFESGVSIFWDAFTEVGERARVFKKVLIKVR